MPRAPREDHPPFSQIDFIATRSFPAGSSFEAPLPVDLSCEDVQTSVLSHIPEALARGFYKHGANLDEFTSLTTIDAFAANRALTSMEEGERWSFERREFILHSLAEHYVAATQVYYTLRHGALGDYALLATPEADASQFSELYAAIDPDTTEYSLTTIKKQAGHHVRTEELVIDEAAAQDFVQAMYERHSGNEAPVDALSMLAALYRASPDRMHVQRGTYIIEQTTTLEARLTVSHIGGQVLRGYLIDAAQELPSGASVALNLLLPVKADSDINCPTASLRMTISDPLSEVPPSERARQFDTTRKEYLTNPMLYIGALAATASKFAEAVLL